MEDLSTSGTICGTLRWNEGTRSFTNKPHLPINTVVNVIVKKINCSPGFEVLFLGSRVNHYNEIPFRFPVCNST
ncbi:hypothetical protein LR48_Vigan503s000200 [Vigna angularis]|uniref:Uncharacterized protein n=1 Tax=Phaseolus angularis TaxID=3914 RepID=A0A0L9TC81_PHAAN|nr:uncharacterized protein HKW66_Vig0114030 [Vigna angularis]KOM28127.1 hypothetical protein LR48_Vigan503s000200 [Vigna angularis]